MGMSEEVSNLSSMNVSSTAEDAGEFPSPELEVPSILSIPWDIIVMKLLPQTSLSFTDCCNLLAVTHGAGKTAGQLAEMFSAGDMDRFWEGKFQSLHPALYRTLVELKVPNGESVKVPNGESDGWFRRLKFRSEVVDAVRSTLDRYRWELFLLYQKNHSSRLDNFLSLYLNSDPTDIRFPRGDSTEGRSVQMGASVAALGLEFGAFLFATPTSNSIFPAFFRSPGKADVGPLSWILTDELCRRNNTPSDPLSVSAGECLDFFAGRPRLLRAYDYQIRFRQLEPVGIRRRGEFEDILPVGSFVMYRTETLVGFEEKLLRIGVVIGWSKGSLTATGAPRITYEVAPLVVPAPNDEFSDTYYRTRYVVEPIVSMKWLTAAPDSLRDVIRTDKSVKVFLDAFFDGFEGCRFLKPSPSLAAMYPDDEAVRIRLNELCGNSEAA
ncbi:hypothetical protein BV898_09415 [Hypsibius exemplaris]|uniref:Uncharacterized protein n=1 Tax=Hypsibius exemplaris TaxID=2072580 RepID=A0A1W0WMI7_HYPEX|nr:hypothetical protein BV898_09415 [Hypsibius exemplaris]